MKIWVQVFIHATLQCYKECYEGLNIASKMLARPQALHIKMKFSVKDFFRKYEQICRKLRIYSHLLKKFSTENFIFYAVREVFITSLEIGLSGMQIFWT